ncbi:MULTISPECIES: GNAT family N-acetyltransferase [unclassified Leptolyngbya]|uniref:GNAT family N-acetyltransferase n=1 Tax=unclassified Leptolyngbya TaxID=2650499 RepID=UPI0016891948|nr:MULTISPECIES: GNAT family N-acetyltransferase [unclassified Leptolyngbya]MBD1912185.1 GNAT family N-acetyltransferase [Leptolyngbya sp. FACHB-8]MBD2155076.1 GNAT family N-acetyltransferase [Leptolyngbya sp. FACHB-16]
MKTIYQNFLIRDWEPGDRQTAFDLIATVLKECGLDSQPHLADWDVWNVEQAYQATGGQFWVVEQEGRMVGTAAFYPVERGEKAVEIRKMYLVPEARGLGLGRFLLGELETVIAHLGYTQIWIETASVLKEAVRLYEGHGYLPSPEVETTRCDRAYVKYLV